MAQFLPTFNHQSNAFFVFPTVVLVAPLVRQADVRKEMQERLRRRAGTSAIWGSGVLHLGPVDRTLALLQRERSRAESDLVNAIEVADRQRMAIWQVTCRLDLATVTGQSRHRHDAEQYADTNEMRRMVETFASPFERL